MRCGDVTWWTASWRQLAWCPVNFTALQQLKDWQPEVLRLPVMCIAVEVSEQLQTALLRCQLAGSLPNCWRLVLPGQTCSQLLTRQHNVLICNSIVTRWLRSGHQMDRLERAGCVDRRTRLCNICRHNLQQHLSFVIVFHTKIKPASRTLQAVLLRSGDDGTGATVLRVGPTGDTSTAGDLSFAAQVRCLEYVDTATCHDYI